MAFISKGGNEVRKERQRAWGWKVECDNSIDPEAARSKMGRKRKWVKGGMDRTKWQGRGRLAVVSQSVKLTDDY